jgi:PAS domain S-box-containing protein
MSDATPDPLGKSQPGGLDLLETMISILPFSLSVADADGRVLMMNQAAEGIFGRTFESARGKSIGDLFLPVQGAADIRMAIIDTLKSGHVWKGDVPIAGADGAPLVVELSAVPLTLSQPGGASINLSLYLGQDVTEERNRLRRASYDERAAARAEMAGEIAHELNNYLSIVCGNLELLTIAIERGNSDNIQSRAGSMKEGLNRITGFVEGLMSVSKREIKKETFSINQFLDNELFLLKSQARFKGINFVCNWGSAIPAIEADRGQIQQVLLELLTNAADALSQAPPGQKKVILSTSYSSSEQRVRLTVSNNGRGLSDEEYQHVFKQHLTAKEGKYGFGLLAVKRAVRIHGGRVSACPGPDGGASFTIELPVRTAAETKKITLLSK